MNIPKGYKQTELGVIPEDWEVRQIRDGLTLLTDFDANGSFADMAENVQTYNGSGFAWYVRATDLEQNTPLTEVKYVDEASYKFLKKSSLYGGEVLIAKRGDIGKVYLFEAKTTFATLAPNLYLLKLNEQIHSTYLYYYLKSLNGQKSLKDINASTSLGALYKEDVKNLHILYPTIPEQKAIAKALSDVDDLIAALDKKIAKKRLVKQGAMQQLLTGKKRLPGFTEEWVEILFGEYVDIYRGGSPRPIENYTTNKPNGINWIKIGDVKPKDKYINKTEECIVPEGVNRSRQVYVGDFILSNSMSFGRPYILNINGCIHDGWLVIQNYHHTFDKDYLYYLLCSEDVMTQYIAMAAGSSVKNLNKEKVASLQLYIPTNVFEQQAIATVLSDMDKEISDLEAKRDKYRLLKSGMMQKLLTGQVRLKTK